MGDLLFFAFMYLAYIGKSESFWDRLLKNAFHVLLGEG